VKLKKSESEGSTPLEFVLDEVIKLDGYTHPYALPATYNVNHLQQVKIPAVFYNDTLWRVTLQYKPEKNVFVLIEAVALE
jgi:hypothetical protein